MNIFKPILNLQDVSAQYLNMPAQLSLQRRPSHLNPPRLPHSPNRAGILEEPIYCGQVEPPGFAVVREIIWTGAVIWQWSSQDGKQIPLTPADFTSQKPRRLASSHSSVGIQTLTGQVSSYVLNDPVDDMWCDVLWADMAKLARGAPVAWQRAGCCFCSPANVSHRALQKTLDWSFFLSRGELALRGYKRNSGSAAAR